MSERLRLLDPMGEANVVPKSFAPRLSSLRGKVGVLLDISKPKGDAFLDRIEEILRGRYGVQEIVRQRKPTFTRPAPEDVLAEIAARADFVVEALAD